MTLKERIESIKIKWWNHLEKRRKRKYAKTKKGKFNHRD